jgi:hypothetical protein
VIAVGLEKLHCFKTQKLFLNLYNYFKEQLILGTKKPLVTAAGFTLFDLDSK